MTFSSYPTIKRLKFKVLIGWVMYELSICKQQQNKHRCELQNCCCRHSNRLWMAALGCNMDTNVKMFNLNLNYAGI